jgi:hypothetical protein
MGKVCETTSDSSENISDNYRAKLADLDTSDATVMTSSEDQSSVNPTVVRRFDAQVSWPLVGHSEVFLVRPERLEVVL